VAVEQCDDVTIFQNSNGDCQTDTNHEHDDIYNSSQ